MKFTLKLALLWKKSENVIDFAYKSKLPMDKALQYNKFIAKRVKQPPLPYYKEEK